MSTIEDFTDAERWTINTTLKERWPNQDVYTECADVEIKLYPHDRELTLCPALFWPVGATSLLQVHADKEKE